jgi:NAD/NADP transhydrogenase alpha subunit
MQIGVPAETPVGHTQSAVAPQTAHKHLTPGHTTQVQAHAGVVTR